MARKCLKSRMVSEVSVNEVDSTSTTSPSDSAKEESSSSILSLSSSLKSDSQETPNSPNQLEQTSANLSLNLPPQSTPLDLRIRKRKKTRPCLSDNQQSKTNYIFSDTNPVCSQIYFQALKETRHGKSISSVSQSDVEETAGVEEEEEEEGGTEEPQNMSDKRRRLKNKRAQRLRNHEKIRHFWMLVQVHNMERRNTALHKQLSTLEREKNELQGKVMEVSIRVLNR